ncbi:MAG: hypothetical protein ACRC33_26915 [Gemmataceae bacterium]
MLRHTVLSAALAAAAFAGLAATPSAADAHPPVGHGRPWHRPRYEVLIRHRGHWDLYRTYRDRDDARQAARFLRMQGYEVRIDWD